MKNRCAWAGNDPDYIRYHDEQWGVPVHDDAMLFEMLILEGMQAGLSWLTILKKRDNFRAAFDGFDVPKIAGYDEGKVRDLMANPGIIRNRLKIHSSIQNAKMFMAVQERYGSFSNYIWQFIGGEPRQNHWASLADMPAKTAESDAMSRELRKLGFNFVGSTICYSFMQAVGMINDHTIDCFRHHELMKKEPD